MTNESTNSIANPTSPNPYASNFSIDCSVDKSDIVAIHISQVNARLNENLKAAKAKANEVNSKISKLESVNVETLKETLNNVATAEVSGVANSLFTMLFGKGAKVGVDEKGVDYNKGEIRYTFTVSEADDDDNIGRYGRNTRSLTSIQRTIPIPASIVRNHEEIATLTKEVNELYTLAAEIQSEIANTPDREREAQAAIALRALEKAGREEVLAAFENLADLDTLPSLPKATE